MIQGIVTARPEIRIRLPILDVTGYEQEFDVVLDTGFTGLLTLPTALIASLQLPWVMVSRVQFADGRVEWIDKYRMTVIWDGVYRSIEVQAIEGDPLIGMELLIGFDLRARVAIGGIVEIEAIP